MHWQFIRHSKPIFDVPSSAMNTFHNLPAFNILQVLVQVAEVVEEKM